MALSRTADSTTPARSFDVFNGDADGLCALHQLRLAAPLDAVLVTGPKRDIALLERVDARAGDRVTVLDVSLDRNRAALERLLARGASVRWFDHHYAGAIPFDPLLEAHIDTAPETCTSAIVDRHLGGRFRAWAVTAAYGDGLARTAEALAGPIGLNDGERATLRALGEDLNYNAYGDTAADLCVPPDALYRELAPYASPLRFAAEAAVVAKLRASRLADMVRRSRSSLPRRRLHPARRRLGTPGQRRVRQRSGRTRTGSRACRPRSVLVRRLPREHPGAARRADGLRRARARVRDRGRPGGGRRHRRPAGRRARAVHRALPDGVPGTLTRARHRTAGKLARP